jgi:NAD(P)-dependent dehydrogenase (short-subunit alcohol dehydrogenase family)
VNTPPPHPSDLATRPAVVTGAAHGIGRAITEALAGAGARVVAIDKDRELLAELCADGQCAPVLGDMASDDVAGLAEKAIRAAGPIELIVNNVGTQTDHGFLELSEEDFDLILRTNLRGPWFFTKRLVEELISSGRPGRILFVSSLHDTYVFGKPHYSASKAAVAMLTKELAYALGSHGIRVNAISPGGIRTHGDLDDLSHPSLPLGRVGVPEDIARMAVVLLSDECSEYVTGANVRVDGGAQLFNPWADRR